MVGKMKIRRNLVRNQSFFSISDKTEVSDTLFDNSLKIGVDYKLFAILKICLCETFLVSLCVIWFLLNTFPDQQFSQKYV